MATVSRCLVFLVVLTCCQLKDSSSAPMIFNKGNQPSETPYEDCGSDGIEITSFEVEGCVELPCPLKLGSNVTSKITFTAKTGFISLSNQIYGIFPKEDIPFYTSSTTICEQPNVTCPIKTGQQVKDVITVHIEDFYPELDIGVKTELVDDNNNMKGCLQIGIKLVK